MNSEVRPGQPGVPVKKSGGAGKLVKSILLTFPMLLLIAMMLTGGSIPQNSLFSASAGIAFLFLGTLFFLMMYTGRTYQYRTIFFVAVAISFVITFITNLIEVRGSMILKAENIISGDTPFCHLVLPMVILPAVLTRTIIFPGSMLEGFANIASMIVIWAGATLALGKGWCSWVCFYGGLDDGFSQIGKKPVIRKIDRKWTYLPYAVLTAIVLLSAAALSPVYCEWLCPFKAVTEFEEIVSFKILVQTIIFVALFLGLVIVLPILTKKRIQCSFLCPYAAFQSFTNKVNIFDIRIDKAKCNQCKKCIRSCPTLSIDDQSLAKGKTCMTCTKCGRCVDICPRGAIGYHIKGTKVGVGKGVARNLFVYSAYLFGATFGGSMIAGAVFRILKLITTGSMI